MPRSFIVRHAESTSNVGKLISGHKDHVPLTPVGHSQAAEAGRQLSRTIDGPVKILTSPLERAHETAKYIATALGVPHDDIIVDHELIERNFGELEGQSGDELHRITKRGTDPDWRPNGGESLNDAKQRALSVFHKAHRNHPGHNLIFVSHGHTLKGILHHFLGTWSSRHTRMGNAEIREVQRPTDEGYAVFFHAWRCQGCGHTWVAQDDDEGRRCHACPEGEGFVFESLADTLIWRALYVD